MRVSSLRVTAADGSPAVFPRRPSSGWSGNGRFDRGKLLPSLDRFCSSDSREQASPAHIRSSSSRPGGVQLERDGRSRTWGDALRQHVRFGLEPVHVQPALPKPRPGVHRLPAGHRRLRCRGLLPRPADRRDAEEERPEGPLPPGQRRQGHVLEHPRRPWLLHRVPRLPGLERHLQRGRREVDLVPVHVDAAVLRPQRRPHHVRELEHRAERLERRDELDQRSVPEERSRDVHPAEQGSDPRLQEAQPGRAHRLRRDRRREPCLDHELARSGTASTSRSSSASTPRRTAARATSSSRTTSSTAASRATTPSASAMSAGR